MELSKAKAIGIEAGKKLQPFSDKLHLAGSIRRRNHEVKDVELCVLPKMIQVPTGDLFQQSFKDEVSPDFIKAVMGLGTVLKGKPTGRMMKIELTGIMLDLFIPARHDYYRQYAIRTGSREYAQFVIAAGWLKIGWCGTEDGLRLQRECVSTEDSGGKKTWKVVSKTPTLPPVWESEEEFFNWLRVPYIDPSERNI